MNEVCNWTSRVAAMLVVLVVLLAPEGASAEVVTLQELEEQALRNQARWEAVEATMARADAEVRAARARRMPSFWMNITGVIAPGSFIERVLTTDGREVNVRASPTVTESEGFRPNVRYEGTIDIRAPLYDGQALASHKAAEAYRAATLAGAGASRETVLAMVRTAYLDWLATHLDYTFAATSAKEARAQHRRTILRVKDGDRPPAELDAARYQELEAELAASDAALVLNGARRLLESAVGVELPRDAEPDSTLLSIGSERPASAQKKWEIEVLELRRDAAYQEAEMHRKTRAPVLAIIGQTGFAGINEYVFPMYRLGLNLSVPLWDGGQAVSHAQAASAQAIELDALARDARLEHAGEQEQAFVERKNAEAQLTIAGDLVAISEKRVEQAEASYDLGAGDLDAVADARAALRRAQSRRVQIQVARVDAVLRLDAAR